MSNNPYEPNPSAPQPEENQPVEAPSEVTEGQVPAQDAAPTIPLEANAAPQPYGAYGQQAPAPEQNAAGAQNNPYAAPQANGAYGQEAAAPQYGTEQNSPYGAPQANGAYGQEATAPQYGTEQNSPYAAANQQPTDGAYAASGAQLNGAAYGAPQQPNYNAYGAAAPQDPQGKKAKNTVGIVAIALSALGFVLGLIYPWIAFIGWFFLFAGFVTGIIGFFQKNKEKITPSIAVALSVLGSIASVIALVIAVAASGSEGTTTSSPTSSSSSSSGEDTSPVGTLKFGETAEYSDGLKFTVSEARTDYTPSKTAVRDDETLTKYVAFTVTIENGTDQPYEPFGLIQGNSGGKEIDQVFDAEKGMGNIRSTKILPGEKVSYDVAFAVADPNNVTLDVTVDLDRDEILYTNK